MNHFSAPMRRTWAFLCAETPWVRSGQVLGQCLWRALCLPLGQTMQDHQCGTHAPDKMAEA